MEKIEKGDIVLLKGIVTKTHRFSCDVILKAIDGIHGDVHLYVVDPNNLIVISSTQKEKAKEKQ